MKWSYLKYWLYYLYNIILFVILNCERNSLPKTSAPKQLTYCVRYFTNSEIMNYIALNSSQLFVNYLTQLGCAAELSAVAALLHAMHIFCHYSLFTDNSVLGVLISSKE